MSEVRILGAGAFGAALAIALARGGRSVALWGRDAAAMGRAAAERRVPRLDAALPEGVMPTADPDPGDAPVILLAVPMQRLGGVLAAQAPALAGRTLVACCKGIDMETGEGASALIARHVPGARAAVLTGPSFAADIAAGLPTALTLAVRGEGEALQRALSTEALRLYLTDDVTGAEIGGALKNVTAIACGAAIGAGMGASARAALMTRGHAEATRLAAALGADPATLAGLSGLGDLALTCHSELSRNYRLGLALGGGAPRDDGVTVEGAATARAVLPLAAAQGVDMPVAEATVALLNGDDPRAVAAALLSRPLRSEAE